MFRKTVNLVLLGVLMVGTAAVGYGTLYGDGLSASLLAVVGAGEEEHDDD